MAVLLFFLRNVPSTLIISISIPFSIIATFVLMYASGFTLNIMSLGGLAMGVGMMVDNSIVVLENSFRLRQEGRPAAEAAVDGAGEVTAAVIASTLTTIVVFLPLIFIRGVSGVMYKQLALVVSFSLICSLVSSLTLVPMMSARLLARAGTGASEPPLVRSLGRAIGRLEGAYAGLLARALNRPLLTVAVIVLYGGQPAAGAVHRLGGDAHHRRGTGARQRRAGSRHAPGAHRPGLPGSGAAHAAGSARDPDHGLQRRRRISQRRSSGRT
jgi:HAE1 family hydrophobic/amphiphilic exporter-1